jgi:hypothetical protein
VVVLVDHSRADLPLDVLTDVQSSLDIGSVQPDVGLARVDARNLALGLKSLNLLAPRWP